MREVETGFLRLFGFLLLVFPAAALYWLWSTDIQCRGCHQFSCQGWSASQWHFLLVKGVLLLADTLHMLLAVMLLLSLLLLAVAGFETKMNLITPIDTLYSIVYSRAAWFSLLCQCTQPDWLTKVLVISTADIDTSTARPGIIQAQPITLRP